MEGQTISDCELYDCTSWIPSLCHSGFLGFLLIIFPLLGITNTFHRGCFSAIVELTTRWPTCPKIEHLNFSSNWEGEKSILLLMRKHLGGQSWMRVSVHGLWNFDVMYCELPRESSRTERVQAVFSVCFVTFYNYQSLQPCLLKALGFHPVIKTMRMVFWEAMHIYARKDLILFIENLEKLHDADCILAGQLFSIHLAHLLWSMLRCACHIKAFFSRISCTEHEWLFLNILRIYVFTCHGTFFVVCA